ncbi:MAG: hypothetical protein UU29_C0002G0034 [Candidatus Daviesbacteria bacterium GW2011_GWA2_40_9]|uniref:VTT domain-containing protein n=1 Tax=Candidatus Daviesbacteria bacterium GW2011_GWA2_40_9 TaxID=1618424 RepID=A0A0G0U904_9BACT|nr:MAG: hypothetical protein UU29_C0002G0034 [Candidatus Daviesbacteria bacterium GW2011_GWA2_40_9]
MSNLFSRMIAVLKHDLFAPVLLIITYVVFIIIARGAIPTSEELIATFTLLYARYGYEIIFVAAALESLGVINLFAPGMVTIGLGAAFARTGSIELYWVIIAASLGALVGYLLDFLIGYFSFSGIVKKMGYGQILQEAREKLINHRTKGLVLGFSYPNIAAFLSLAAGTSRMPFWQFISIAILSTFSWATLWGYGIYLVGDSFILVLSRYSFVIMLLVVATLVFSKLLVKEKKG